MKIFKYKIFIVLLFIAFSTVTGASMAVTLLPVYCFDLGVSGFEIGLILSVFSISRGLFLPYFGKLSDNKGRKKYIIKGLGCYALISTSFLFSKKIESIIILRFIQGIASAMILPAVQSYVGKISPNGKEGRISGIFNMFIFIALGTGPPLGGLLKEKLNINLALFSISSLSTTALIISMLLLPLEYRKKNIKKNISIPWKKVLKDRITIGLISIKITYTTCIGIIWGFLPILTHNEYKLSPSITGIIITLGVGINGIMQIPMGVLSDKINRKLMIIIGSVITIFSVYSFTITKNSTMLACSNILFGIGGSIINPSIMATTIIRSSIKKSIGFTMSLVSTGHSIGMILGTLITGTMIDFIKLKQAFYIGPIIMFLGLFIFMYYTKKHNLN